jgi:hypothetical protein
MEFDQAVAYAKDQANRTHRNQIISLAKKTLQWTVQPGCDAKLPGHEPLYRVKPIDRHWNGSRVIESQPVEHLTDGVFAPSKV